MSVIIRLISLREIQVNERLSRMKSDNVYIRMVKARLNLTIDNNLLESGKAYAASKHTSLSKLVEGFLKTLTRPAKRKNVIDLIEKMDKPNLDTLHDLKDQYYKDRSGKYGF